MRIQAALTLAIALGATGASAQSPRATPCFWWARRLATFAPSRTAGTSCSSSVRRSVTAFSAAWSVSVNAAPSQEIFTMATVGGADALGRPDLGRLASGCKADIVFVRCDTFKASPFYDPFMFLVLSATGDDVDRVIVNGQTIVEDARVLAVDMPSSTRHLNDTAQRVRARIAL